MPAAGLSGTDSEASIPRRSAKEVHRSTDRPKASKAGGSSGDEKPSGRSKRGKARKPKTAPTGGQLGSFMYVKNSQFEASVAAGKPHSPDNPKYWVGQVNTIQPGGQVQLEWHRETSLGSGLYAPTRFPFSEQSSLLRPFRTAVFDRGTRAWQCFPVVEAPEVDEDTLSANEAAIKSHGPRQGGKAGVTDAVADSHGKYGEKLSVGSFVYMKNARFLGGADTDTDLPRYWVCRITAIQAPSGGSLPAVYVGRVPPDAGTVERTAAESASLRLQWFREVQPGCGLYNATGEFFSERPRVVRELPSGLTYRKADDVWAREGVARGPKSDPSSPQYTPPHALLFPGDTPLPSEVAKSKLAAAGDAPPSGSDRVLCSPTMKPHDGGPVPCHVGDFAFVPNVKFSVATESTQNPKNWVVRVSGLTLRSPPAVPAAQATIQWYMEAELGSGLYKPTARTFPELVSLLKPLFGMTRRSDDCFELAQPHFDLSASFAEPNEASLHPAPTEVASGLPAPGMSLSGALVASPSAGAGSQSMGFEEVPAPPPQRAAVDQGARGQPPSPAGPFGTSDQAPPPPAQPPAPPAAPVPPPPQQTAPPPPPDQHSSAPQPGADHVGQASAPAPPLPSTKSETAPEAPSATVAPAPMPVAEAGDPSMKPLPLFVKAMITGISQLSVPAVGDGMLPDDPEGQNSPRKVYAIVKLAFTNPQTGKLKLRHSSAGLVPPAVVQAPHASCLFENTIWQWHVEDDPSQTTTKTATPNTVVVQVWACPMSEAPAMDPASTPLHAFCGSATLRVDTHDAVQHFVSPFQLPRPAQANPVLPPVVIPVNDELDEVFDKQFLTQPGA